MDVDYYQNFISAGGSNDLAMVTFSTQKSSCSGTSDTSNQVPILRYQIPGGHVLWEKQYNLITSYYQYMQFDAAKFEPTNSTYQSAKYIFAILKPDATSGNYAFLIIQASNGAILYATTLSKAAQMPNSDLFQIKNDDQNGVWRVEIGLITLSSGTAGKQFVLNHFTVNYKSLAVIKYSPLISSSTLMYSLLVFIDVNTPSKTWITYSRKNSSTPTTNQGFGYIQ